MFVVHARGPFDSARVHVTKKTSLDGGRARIECEVSLYDAYDGRFDVEPCKTHKPREGEVYEAPRIMDGCTEYECCTNHEREVALRAAFFDLGREYERRLR